MAALHLSVRATTTTTLLRSATRFANVVQIQVRELNDKPPMSPAPAAFKPDRKELTAGEEYYWCSCGLSNIQPFCNGAHEGTGLKPHIFKQEKTETKSLCLCKATSTPPFCDGSHKGLEKQRPKIASYVPARLDLEAGKTYHWCTCGHSENQPWCDGSHARNETGFMPLEFTVEKDGRKSLCTCKYTRNPPFCDGTHKALKKALPPDEVKDVWHRVGGVEDFKNNGVHKVYANGKDIALMRDGDTLKAIDGMCPHQGGPLSEGSFEMSSDGKAIVRCPWHGWGFDMDGKNEDGGEGVQSYPVEIRSDGIYISTPSSAPAAKTVSDVMTDTMVDWNVTHVFGMVGHSNLGLADAIRRKVEKGKMQFVGVRHEGAAAFACSGFAKLSGLPAACLTIAGPGATNLLTGLWDCHVDQAPVLALTGQVQTQVLGPGAFQEIDLNAAFNTVAHFSHTVLKESNHSELMALAVKNALLKRNVAHLVFPDEVQDMPLEGAKISGPAGRYPDRSITPPAEKIVEAADMLTSAKRPTIIVGYGALGKMDEIVALAEEMNAPILTTFKAKGQVGDDHPLACGVLGRSGTPVASWAMSQSDLLLVFGATFSVHTGISADIPTIQVDFDPMAIGKFHPVSLGLYGEISTTSRALHNALTSRTLASEDRKALIAERWADWREEKRKRASNHSTGISNALIFQTLSKIVPENAIIAADVGNNTYSFGRYFESKKGLSVLMSGYLGSIGFGFPAAMGAFCATKVIDEHAGRQVFSISGDGGFAQYLAEFTTAVKYNMNITHVLLHNSELAKISLEQRLAKHPVWETTLVNPNFAAYAEMCGGKGIRVTDPADLESALRDAAAHNGPALVEIMSSTEQ
eukprot:m.108892 g.108892  ORF g.108892 m.108892 type:complete len:861 (-) comp13984_c0_seq2:135-2717(-)